MTERCGTEPWHGSNGGYNNHGCRGDECTAAHAKANLLAWRKRNPTTAKVKAIATAALIKRYRHEYIDLLKDARAELRQQAAEADRRRREINHGTGYGYIQHRRAGEQPCDECERAHVAGRAETERLRDQRAS